MGDHTTRRQQARKLDNPVRPLTAFSIARMQGRTGGLVGRATNELWDGVVLWISYAHRHRRQLLSLSKHYTEPHEVFSPFPSGVECPCRQPEIKRRICHF